MEPRQVTHAQRSTRLCLLFRAALQKERRSKWQLPHTPTTLPLTFISSCLSESVTRVGGRPPSSRGHWVPQMAPRMPRPRIHNASYHVRVRITVASGPRRPLCVSMMSGDSAPSHVFCCVVCACGRVYCERVRESRAARAPRVAPCRVTAPCSKEFVMTSFHFMLHRQVQRRHSLALCLQHDAASH